MKERPPFFGLQAKFTLFILTVVILLLAAFTCTNYLREKDAIVEGIRGKSVLVSASLAQRAYDPMASFAFPLVKSYIAETMEASPEIMNIWVLDQSGTCIGSNDTAMENRKPDLPAARVFAAPDMTRARAAAAGARDVRLSGGETAEALTYFARDSLVAGNRILLRGDGRQVIDTRGAVVVETSLRLLHEKMRGMLVHNLVLFVVFMGIAVILANIMASFIIAPLNLIIKGTEKVAMGDFSTRLKVESSDELGLLAERFNVMTENVYFLHDVAKATSFMNDTEELLKTILDKVKLAVKAERGSLMLLDDETDVLVLKVVRGDVQVLEAEDKAVLKPGEGVAGQVVREGKSLIVNEGHKAPQFKSFANRREAHIRNMLVVPLKVDDKPIGVINVVNKLDGDFRERDLKLVEAMASTASMAIQNAKLYELAITDGLTKMFIHRYFQARLEDEVVRARRYGNTFSLVMFDIDHFKGFNDKYGHQQGDDVIIEIARITKETLRSGVDIASRYGGEEFTAILPETDTQGGLLFAERLRKAVEEHSFPCKKNGEGLRVTISLGVSTYPKHAADRMSLIKLSDEALYASKRKGRNAVTSADEL
ncbi:MAG: diguanylate cyclase [Elusimicrobiota bacterium]